MLADGVLFVKSYEREEWLPSVQTQQISVIDFSDEKESLLISIKGDLKGEKLVWLFPIPAEPQSVKIDVIKNFPTFSGYEVKSRVGYEVDRIFPIFTFSQGYPIFYYFFGAFSFGGVAKTEGFEEERGVVIHEHLEKAGISVELVSAEDSSKFLSYLNEKGLVLPNSLVEEYIGKKYSFVVGWVSDVEKYKIETEGSLLGLKIEFPTKKIYYPLKLTSLYGNQKIPIRIYVLGHVSPEIFDSIANSTKVSYYINDTTQIKYTKIQINSNSNLLTQDLWIGSSSPLEISFAALILFSPPLFMGIVFILCSIIASIVSGLIVFKRKLSIKTLTLLGITNLLTIIGVFISSLVLIKRKEKKILKSLGIFIMLGVLCVILYLTSAFFTLSIAFIFALFVGLVFLGVVVYVIITAPEILGYTILFSIIFIILFSSVYVSLITLYPYKVSRSLWWCESKIREFCTMWAMGRVSDPSFWEDFAPECNFPVDESVCIQFGIEIPHA
ncbi:MAG: DUF2330 domain-containing protein [Candidatus Aenigmatarchaeota archaeon]